MGNGKAPVILATATLKPRLGAEQAAQQQHPGSDRDEAEQPN